MREKLAVALVVALACLASLTGSALAQTDEDTYPMFFPLIGDFTFTDTFGAPRGGGRTHAGIDILAPKMTPVLAVADGTVGWMHDELGGNCCDLEIIHDDGWRSRYIHLNNDTPGTDDGQGWGFADGIEEGAWVPAGSLIGWVGDSGNAEWTSPHLHFELHQPDGTVINPYEILLAAVRLDEPLTAQWVPPFRDDEGSPHEADIARLFETGITTGCGPERYCPDRSVVRSEMAAFLTRISHHLGTVEGEYPYQGLFADVVEDDWYAEDVEMIYAEGITRGCALDPLLYCPEPGVTRAEMAAFLVRSLSLPEGEPAGFTDTVGHYFESEIDALLAAGITLGCSETEFCPDEQVTRAQMASFLIRGLDYAAVASSG